MKSSSIGFAFDLILNLSEFFIVELRTVTEEAVKRIIEITRTIFIKYSIPQ
jgi:hypothetical protein